MPDLYTLPTSNVTDIVDYIGWTSEVSGHILFPLLILVIGFIVFLATKNFTAPIAFALSTFIISLLAIPITIAGWMNPMYMYFCFVLFGISLLALRISGTRGGL